MTRVLWLLVFVCVVQCLPMSKDELEDFSNFLLKTSSLDIHVKSADPDDSYDEDEVVSDHAWEESGKFEGDLILNDRQRRLIVENVEGLSRNGLTDSTKRWPNNEVVYFIQREHFTSGQVQAIQDGIDDLAQASCVKFRPYRKGDRDAVVIQGSRRGCFSQVGYQGGYQVLNLSGRHPVGRGCFRHGTVIHELLHSLGFYHMQSSPDRDDYIDVIWANIVQPARHNFRKYNSFSVSDFGVGYDYDSVLHYSRRAFSANGQDTLVPKKSGAEIGQRTGLSDKDTQKLNKMYCDADNDPAVQADENVTKKPKKKKKPKNQPFEGHGIGYHQGKTVVIKLPAAETYKLPNVPSTHVFDFSKTSQIVPPEAEGYRFGEEITYTYKPLTSLTFDITKDYDKPEFKPIVNKDAEQQHATEDDVIPPKENKIEHSSLQHSNDVKPEYVPIDDYDKDLKEAFDRLTKIVKQHIYPTSESYDHNIDKDYSKFITPLRRQQSDPIQSTLADKLEPMSYGPSTELPQKQLEITQHSDDNFKNNQIQDRMDVSFRTSLPTKKPYSSYEQTETPDYATLEYLKNRHDFSNIYSPESSEGNTQKDEGKTHVNGGDKYTEDIKINPYDRVLYTDQVNKHIEGHLKDAPIQETGNDGVKLDKYEPEKKPKQINLDEGIDSSYRTLLPITKPYSAYEQTETPKYATLEYLKDRHDISNIYPSKKAVHNNEKETHAVFEDDHPPTKGDWYIKESDKHNPANYDRDSYSDYVRSKYKEHDEYDENDNDKSTKDLLENTSLKNTPGYDDRDQKQNTYIRNDYGDVTVSEKNKDANSKKTSAEPDHSNHDYSYFGKYRREEDDHSVSNEDNEPRKKLLIQSLKPLEYSRDYNPDYVKEHNASSEEFSNEEDTSNLPPKKSQPYTLYGVPVPLTNDWFKISYAIPEVFKTIKSTP